MVEKPAACLGASLAQSGAAELDRLAARGIALVWGGLGVAALQPDAPEADLEFLGRNLAQRGQHSLADFDPAGRDRDPARLAEPNPLIEPRVLFEKRRQPWNVGAHPASPAQIRRAASATARRMRGWLPQRQRWSSRAVAISAREGAGLLPSKALAEIRMPDRQ